jgi:hypothetical protein
MLLNVAAHNVSIRNVKVSKRERHIMYSVTKHTASQNVKCTLNKRYKMFCNGDAVRYVTFTFWKLYVLEHLHCVQLCFVTLHHVTFTLRCFTLCSNIQFHLLGNIQRGMIFSLNWAISELRSAFTESMPNALTFRLHLVNSDWHSEYTESTLRFIWIRCVNWEWLKFRISLGIFETSTTHTSFMKL